MKLGNKVKKIKKIDEENCELILQFKDGFTGRISLKKIFSSPSGLASEIMQGNLFSHCFIESGALAWPNGLELCPDAIRQWIKEQSHKKAA